MNTKITDLCRTVRRSAGVKLASQMLEVKDGELPTAEPATVTTMADSVRPLLTSMKLFGQYFKCNETGENMTDDKPRRRWNGCMIYALVVVGLLWINVARMFSMFRNVVNLSDLDLFVLSVCLPEK